MASLGCGCHCVRDSRQLALVPYYSTSAGLRRHSAIRFRWGYCRRQRRRSVVENPQNGSASVPRRVVTAQWANALQAFDVGRSWTLRGLLDVELDVLTFLQVRAANVFHVEEDVVIRILSVDKAVTACVVEEINGSLRHCI